MREIYHGAEEISERHRHRYEFNPEFRQILEQNGLIFSGNSPDGKFVEMIELPKDKHPYFVGCQFHPEYKSKPLQAHPLFVAFVRAAWENRQNSENLKEDVRSDIQPQTETIDIHDRFGNLIYKDKIAAKRLKIRKTFNKNILCFLSLFAAISFIYVSTSHHLWYLQG